MEITISLRQHIGEPCKPIVAMGENVKKGQLIAIPEKLGANIHSSVYGNVVDINENEIKIEAFEKQPDEYVKLKETDYLEMIKEAGIVGSGGAGFPTYIKLDTDLTGGYIIANGVECEPLLGHNIKMIEEYGELVIRGIEYTMKITNAKKGYVAIKSKHTSTIELLERICKEKENIEVKLLPDVYPAGDQRFIIREILGVTLELGESSNKANATVCNVETLKNIALAIEKRKPVITKDITIAGKINNIENRQVFLDVPIGVPIKHYIEKLGGYEKNHGEIVLGGPFTGRPGNEDSPVTKVLGGIFIADQFQNEEKKVGIIACECGAQEDRLVEIARNMGMEVIAQTKCIRMKEVKGRFRCELSGISPEQLETVSYLKDKGAEAIVVGTCENCTKAINKSAKDLGIQIYHSTDHILRAGNHKLYR